MAHNLVKIGKKWGQRIFVEWRDAILDDEWISTISALNSDKDQICYTSAFYIGEDNHNLVVAMTIGKTEEDEVAGVWKIPKGCIIRWR